MLAVRRSYIDWLLRKVDPGIEGTFGFTDILGKVSLNPSPRHSVAAMVIGVRHALDYSSTGRALAVCGLAFLLALIVAFVMGVFLGPTVS